MPGTITAMSLLTDTPIESFAGEIVTPGHPDYEAARRVWHGAIDRRPGLIARARSTGDVVAALRFALDRELPFAVRAGGHSLAGFSVVEDGLVIDLRELRQRDVI